MRIESISLSQQVFEDMGVGTTSLPLPLKMRNLGRLVVLAGKNGSGKSRLFELLEKIQPKHIDNRIRESWNDELSQLEKLYKSLSEELKAAAPNSIVATKLQTELHEKERKIGETKQSLQIANSLIVSGDALLHMVRFVPRSSALEQIASLTDVDVQQHANHGLMSMEQTAVGAPSYARQLLRAAIAERGARKPLQSDTSPLSAQSAEEELLRLFRELIGSDIEFELDASLNLSLRDIPGDYLRILSDGQKVLFQLACLLHARGATLANSILLLDEPENYLHPAALNEVIDRLLALLPDEQLWIATHSVPLIAHLVAKEPNCLWFADGGHFTPAGRTPEKVLDSLLGGPAGAKHVNELTLLPSRLASMIFLSQCLHPPGVSEHRNADPQLSQICTELNKLQEVKGSLSVIDFGAGKGRLLEALIKGDEYAPAEVAGKVNYVAYEPGGDTKNLLHCQTLCSVVYGDDRPRAFSSLDDLKKAHGAEFADVVVVCNVLHEVPPADWLKEFGGQSVLAQLLKRDGYLLFVEDYALPIGERAHEYGFLLLGKKQIQALFAISAESPTESFSQSDHSNPQHKGRLIAHLVAASHMRAMTEDTCWKAIHSLHEEVRDRLRQLLSRQADQQTASKHGREMALVTQLVANSALWLHDNPRSGGQM